jgi:hypothetical protein
MIYCLLIVAINLAVYWPVLFHYVRSDLWLLHLNTMGYHGLLDLITGTISYTRSTLYSPQDILSFRPLGNVFLSFEKFFFGFNFTYWQAAGLLLHIVLLLLLFKFIKQIVSSRLVAFVGVIFLSFLPAGFELVIWSYHIVYIVLICTMAVMFFLQKTDHFHGGKSLFLIVMAMFIGVFTHELGIFSAISFIITAFPYRNDSRLIKSAFFSAVLILMSYVVLDLVDYRIHSPYIHAVSATVTESNNIISNLNPLRWLNCLAGAIGLVFAWVFIPLFPSLFETIAAHRTYLFYDFNIARLPFLVLNVLFFSVCVLIFLRVFSYASLKRNRVSFAFASLFLFLLAFAVYGGRVATRGWAYILSINTYYYYIAWVFFIIVLACGVDRLKLNKVTNRLKLMGIVLLLIFMAFSCSNIVRINSRYNKIFFEHKRFKAVMENFVAQHKNEPNFNFIFKNHYRYDVLVPISVLRCGKNFSDCRIDKEQIASSYILFSPYCLGGYNDLNFARYILEYDDFNGLRSMPRFKTGAADE